jgi:putative hydrolase of the HAD superfamily
MNQNEATNDAGDLLAVIRRLSTPLTPQPSGFPARLEAVPDVGAVIFDIYGTLLISGSGDVGPASAEQSEQALREALSASGLPLEQVGAEVRAAEILAESIAEAQALRRREGIEFPEVDIIAVWRQVLAKLFPRVSSLDVGEARLRRLALEYECRTNPVWPMPGMRATLAALRASGRRLGIVSNAQFYTPLMFHALLGAPVDELGFDPRLCVWSYKALEGKPSLRLFRRLSDQLASVHGLRPEQTLYVGNDMLKDIWPAAQLGFKTALFAGDRRSLRLRENDERCRALQPDLVIDHIEQLTHCNE